jgi:peptide/nickel transport system substrate-binding protein
MTTKLRFLTLALATAASVLLASCGAPGASTTTQPTTSLPTTRPPATGTATPLPTAADKPKYGGVITIITGELITSFDEVYGRHPAAHTLKLTNEELFRGDWTKGPAGTGQVDWAVRGIGRLDLAAGVLAESWEIPQQGTIVFHIRKGVRWALNGNSEASRLVAGREMNGEDIVYSLNSYAKNPRAYLNYAVSGVKDATITAPDKWTVKVEISPEFFEAAVSRVGDFASIVPQEVVQKYGSMQDWRVSVGTGPFMLTDFVSDSSATLVRNPKYWDTDPIGPGKGNQLPYLDGVKYLLVLDTSTTLAALRTAKADVMRNVAWEDALNTVKMYPQMQSKKWMSDGGSVTFMRTDKAPFSDKRVRRALMMATDFQAILKDFQGGDGLVLSWPITNLKEYLGAYLPLEQAPDSVNELYKYAPEKAKTLFAEAGYPNGFKATVICSTAGTAQDYFSILKAMWAKVGVDLAIDPREPAVFSNIQASRSYDSMIFSTQGPIGALYRAEYASGNGQVNGSYVNDPAVSPVRAQMQLNALTNPAEADRIHKDFMKYVLDQAWTIPYTYGQSYHLWWPWVKNFHGEMSVGYDNSFVFTKWAWIDQDLKEQMSGRR